MSWVESVDPEVVVMIVTKRHRHRIWKPLQRYLDTILGLNYVLVVGEADKEMLKSEACVVDKHNYNMALVHTSDSQDGVALQGLACIAYLSMASRTARRWRYVLRVDDTMLFQVDANYRLNAFLRAWQQGPGASLSNVFMVNPTLYLAPISVADVLELDQDLPHATDEIQYLKQHGFTIVDSMEQPRLRKKFWSAFELEIGSDLGEKSGFGWDFDPRKSPPVLVLIISCVYNREEWGKIRDYMDNNVHNVHYLIIVGGPINTTMSEIVPYRNVTGERNVISVRERDLYEHLPEKVFVAFETVTHIVKELPQYSHWRYIFKADDDTRLSSDFAANFIKFQEYIENKTPPMHFVSANPQHTSDGSGYAESKISMLADYWRGGVSSGHFDNSKLVWHDGACGYLVSLAAVQKQVPMRNHSVVFEIYQTEIFEDVAVARSLRDNSGVEADYMEGEEFLMYFALFESIHNPQCFNIRERIREELFGPKEEEGEDEGEGEGEGEGGDVRVSDEKGNGEDGDGDEDEDEIEDDDDDEQGDDKDKDKDKDEEEEQ